MRTFTVCLFTLILIAVLRGVLFVLFLGDPLEAVRANQLPNSLMCNDTPYHCLQELTPLVYLRLVDETSEDINFVSSATTPDVLPTMPVTVGATVFPTLIVRVITSSGVGVPGMVVTASASLAKPTAVLTTAMGLANTSTADTGLSFGFLYV